MGVRPSGLVGHQPCSITLWWLVRVRPAPPPSRLQPENPGMFRMPPFFIWSADENPERRNRPAADAVALLNLPSIFDAKFQNPLKCRKANIHRAICYANLVKSPTRLPED